MGEHKNAIIFHPISQLFIFYYFWKSHSEVHKHINTYYKYYIIAVTLLSLRVLWWW